MLYIKTQPYPHTDTQFIFAGHKKINVTAQYKEEDSSG